MKNLMTIPLLTVGICLFGVLGTRAEESKAVYEVKADESHMEKVIQERVLSAQKKQIVTEEAKSNQVSEEAPAAKPSVWEILQRSVDVDESKL